MLRWLLLLLLFDAGQWIRAPSLALDHFDSIWRPFVRRSGRWFAHAVAGQTAVIPVSRCLATLVHSDELDDHLLGPFSMANLLSPSSAHSHRIFSFCLVSAGSTPTDFSLPHVSQHLLKPSHSLIAMLSMTRIVLYALMASLCALTPSAVQRTDGA